MSSSRHPSPGRVARATLVFVTLAALGAACGNKGSSSSSTTSTNCPALAICCASPSLPASGAPTCNSTVKEGNDAACQSALSTLNGLGYCTSKTGAGGSGAGGSGAGGSGAGGSGNGGSGNGGSGNGGGATTTTTSSSTSTSSGTSSGGPIIQSLTANPTPVTPAGTTISAIVADTNGVATLTGGTLTDKVYGTTYGAFATPGGQGTFDYALTWAAVYQAHAISFAAGASEARVVTARFFDNKGNTASQDLTLTLACTAATDSPCSTACADLMTDVDNCGACGTTCASKAVCQHGGAACACIAGRCTDTVTSLMETGATCNAVCGAVPATCVANTCPGLPTGAQDLYGNNFPCTQSSTVFHTCCCQ